MNYLTFPDSSIVLYNPCNITLFHIITSDIEECIKSSPEFDENLFNNRDRIKAQKSAEYERDMAIGDAIRQGADVKTAFRNGGQNMPKCPTCGSLNVEKISTGKKIFGGAMFGLFSSDVRNTMHCKNCGAKW